MALASLVLVLAVVTGIRIRLLSLPLERDEGEYAYAGQLLLQDIAPYKEMYSMKWPGTFAVYAVTMGFFGQSIVAIHSGLLLTVLPSVGILFFIGRNMYGPIGASVAAGTYALLAITPPTLGLAAHATHFVVLPALGGILLLQTLSANAPAWRVALAGVLFGLAALMKQSGIIFGLFGALWLLRIEGAGPERDNRRLRIRFSCLVLGGLLPFGITCALLAGAGVFGRFWFWTVKYSQTYAGLLSPLQGLQFLSEIAPRLFEAAPALWGLALLGLVLVWVTNTLARWRFFLTGFTLFSFLAVCPGWYFREHYFLLLLPAAGLLAGAAVALCDPEGAYAWQQEHGLPRAISEQAPHSLSRAPNRVRPGIGALDWLQPVALGGFAVAAAWTLYISRDLFFRASPAQASHLLYRGNAFPECLQLGRYLAEHCPAESRIAVLGSEPELYFYSHRRSATGHIYMYPLMEPQPYAKTLQEEMIREILTANPDYFVFVGVSTSWLPHGDSDASLLSWFETYRREHLAPVALVQLFSDAQVEYDWSGAHQPEAARPKRWLEVYRRTGK